MVERFKVTPLPLVGLHLVERQPLEDARGMFERVFCEDEFGDIGLDMTVAQINRSVTNTKGTVRGMHYQLAPHGERKFVSCTAGAVFDVVVDLRRNSPTFLQWHGEVLSDTNGRSLFIPEGFAHGFQTQTDCCQMLYLHSAPYAPAAAAGISPTDPRVGIDWPEKIMQLAARDTAWPPIPADYEGILP